MVKLSLKKRFLFHNKLFFVIECIFYLSIYNLFQWKLRGVVGNSEKNRFCFLILKMCFFLLFLLFKVHKDRTIC